MQRRDSARPCKSSDGEPALDADADADVDVDVDVALQLARPADDARFYAASVHFLRRRLQEKSDSARGGSWSCCDLAAAGGWGGAQGAARRQSIAQFCLDTPRLNSAALPMYQVLPFPKSNKDSLFSKIKKKFQKLRQQLDEGEAAADEDTRKISNFKFPRCSRLTPAARAGPAPTVPAVRPRRRPRRALGGISEEESSADADSDDYSAKTTGTA